MFSSDDIFFVSVSAQRFGAMFQSTYEVCTYFMMPFLVICFGYSMWLHISWSPTVLLFMYSTQFLSVATSRTIYVYKFPFTFVMFSNADIICGYVGIYFSFKTAKLLYIYYMLCIIWPSRISEVILCIIWSRRISEVILCIIWSSRISEVILCITWSSRINEVILCIIWSGRISEAIYV